LSTVRACAPFAASFQGTRVGRFLTRSFFHSYKNCWQPIQNVKNLNLQSDDCCERDEISQTADLAKFGRLVAGALGSAQQIGVDGMEGQKEALAQEGFRQIGAGSGKLAINNSQGIQLVSQHCITLIYVCTCLTFRWLCSI
jgi:hypothetical protein